MAVVATLLAGAAGAAPRLLEPFEIPRPPEPWPAVTGERAAAPAPEADAGLAEPQQGPRVWRVGPTRALRTVSEVARLARDGDTVEIDAGDYRGDVAVWLQRRLTIRGVGGQARLHADGRSAEGKAIWVIRNGRFDVSHVDFIGARVPDGNGAGIRFENGHLVVRHCLFWGSQSGILTAAGPSLPSAQLEVLHSEFAYNGDGRGRAHHLYAGNLGLLRVVGSYFHHGNVGHLIKSRAAVNELRYNRLTDEGQGRASYLVDLSNGGLGVLVGNLLQQGPRAENAALVSYGAEGYKWPDNRLYVSSNTFVNDLPRGGVFLRSNVGLQSVYSINNVFSGRGGLQVPEGALTSINEQRTDGSGFRLAAHYDYRLKGDARDWPFVPPEPEVVQGMGLVPTAAYRHPRRAERLSTPPTLPGALQGTGD